MSGTLKFIIALGIGLGLFGLSTLYFNPLQSKLIGAIAFMVALWSNEGMELGAVSMFPLLLFPSFDIISFNDVAPNYAKPIIFLFIGGFLLAVAMQKTKLHVVFAHKILSLFPKTALGIMYALAITAALLSAVLSNTTTTVLLIPIALFLTQSTQLKVRFVLAVAYGATIGGIITPIGTAPNLILLQFLNESSLEPVSFFGWIFKVFPLVAIMLTFMPWFLNLGNKEKTVERPPYDKKPLTTQQKKVTYILLGLIALLLINSPIRPYYDGLGLNEQMLLLGAGVLMFVPKIDILAWHDTKDVPYSIVFLFGASFSIAAAFSSTGLGHALAEPLSVISTWPWLLLLIAVAFFVSFSTEVTSNTALISIVLPLFFTLASTTGLDALPMLMVATIASSYAFMLPIATPPNAIAMSTGIIRVSHMVKLGVVLNSVGVLLLGLIAYFIW